jgi:DNA repair photolyase
MATTHTLRPAADPSRIRRVRPEQTSLTLFPHAARHGNDENACGASAPTPVPDRGTKPAAELVGIARLAASSLRANAKRGTEYFVLPVRSIINRCDSPRVPFNYTINPYRGCEFGCHYCYARYTHEFMEIDGGEFEKKIYAKRDAGALVARDLENPRLEGEHIAIGAATDPYQPAEREFGVTRAILEKMAGRSGLSVSITTKSNQVLRDLDLLQRIAERSSISVNLSITTMRTRLARLLEPRAPRPDLRMEAVQALRKAGIAAGVLAMPVIPGITDAPSDLETLVRAARDADAQWVGARVLYLMPAALRQFLPFVHAKFPRLARQYDEWYRRHGGAPKNYTDEISRRFVELRKKYGISSRPAVPMRPPCEAPQMSLGLPPVEKIESREESGFKHLPGMPVVPAARAGSLER